MRRTELELLIAIMAIVREPKRKTHVLYKCGINWYQMKRYEKILLQYKLITSKDNILILTDKGFRFLELMT